MMINKRLINTVKESKKYIAGRDTITIGNSAKDKSGIVIQTSIGYCFMARMLYNALNKL